jgi:polyisoprenoid-binding protein YceI
MVLVFSKDAPVSKGVSDSPGVVRIFFVHPSQRRPVLKGRSVAPLALLVALSFATELSAQNRTAPAASSKNNTFTTWNVAAIGNEARYRVFEELASIGHNEVIGKTRDVKGKLVLDGNGAIVKDSSRIVVNAQTLQTDQKRRDNHLKTQTLETEKFPQITLVPVSFEGFTGDIPAGQEKTFTMLGDLTVRNVTKPTKWDVVARRQGNDIVGTAKTVFTLQDFNIEKPRVVMVLSVADTVRLEYDFHFAPTTAVDVVK